MTTETTVTATETVTPGQLVAAKTICLVLKLGTFGNAKKGSLVGAVLSIDDPSQEPDKALLRLSKTLLDSPELTAIQKHDRDLAAKIRAMAFSSLFKGGVYMLPIAMVTEANDLLTKAVARRAQLVDLAVKAYPIRVEETIARLGVAARESDYPSAERYRQTFTIEYSYVTFETPSRLKAISAALFQQEAEKARVKLESVAQECEQTMRAGLLQLVDHLTDRLTPDADGKSKRLSHSTITHLGDFLTTFELRNVTDDEQLGAIVEQARKVMQGVDHGVLKSDDLIRQKVLADLQSVSAALNPLVIEKGTRSIELED